MVERFVGRSVALCAVILRAFSSAATEGAVNSVGGGTKIGDGSDLPPDQFFLNKIFSKYGDEGLMTFEGFEHLMDNLGLGGGLFQAPHDLSLHRINGTFTQIHDPSHRHKRHTTNHAILKSESWQCMSPGDILEVYGFENQPGVIIIGPKTFMNLCPALVYQLDQKSCYQTAPLGADIKNRYLGWIYAGLTVFVISAIGLLGAAIMPLVHSVIFDQILHFLVAMAIGTLCGDALLHLLPHALIHAGNDKEDHTTPIFKCGLTFLTILLFYSMETIMRIATGKSSHGHTHSMKNIDINHDVDEIELHVMMPKPMKKNNKSMTPVALMVILGDGLHNLTDGLAIGAAFSADPVTGFATALAVFCHELPHELGDFAVLIKSGMTIKKALCYNILSSILSFIGTAIGLWLAEDHASSSQWIYAATAGTFLYIALADLVPEISGHGSGNIVEFGLAFLGIILGGILMLSIALYEDKLVYLFEPGM